MPDTIIYIILGIIALVAIIFIMIMIAKGRLKALKPFIEKIIVQAEVWAQDENIEKAGVEKMTKVVNEVIKRLPSWTVKLIPTGYIETFCQVVYNSIQDKLVELCEDYRKEHLTETKKVEALKPTETTEFR